MLHFLHTVSYLLSVSTLLLLFHPVAVVESTAPSPLFSEPVVYVVQQRQVTGLAFLADPASVQPPYVRSPLLYDIRATQEERPMTLSVRTRASIGLRSSPPFPPMTSSSAAHLQYAIPPSQAAFNIRRLVNRCMPSTTGSLSAPLSSSEEEWEVIGRYGSWTLVVDRQRHRLYIALVRVYQCRDLIQKWRRPFAFRFTTRQSWSSFPNSRTDSLNHVFQQVQLEDPSTEPWLLRQLTRLFQASPLSKEAIWGWSVVTVGRQAFPLNELAQRLVQETIESLWAVAKQSPLHYYGAVYALTPQRQMQQGGEQDVLVQEYYIDRYAVADASNR